MEDSTTTTSTPPKRNSKRRHAVHQDVEGSLWFHLTEEEVQAVRGATWRRRSTVVLEMGDPFGSYSSMKDLEPAITIASSSRGGRRASFLRRVRTRSHSPTGVPTRRASHKETGARSIQEPPQEEVEPPGWILWACGVVGMGVGCSVPFNQMLAADPGSPLFITFVTSLFMVLCNLPKVASKLMYQKKTTLPLQYHAASVILGYGFNVLRADAFTRLPPAVAVILMNCKMVVGMLFDSLVLGTRYSGPQVTSAGIVTGGILWSGLSTLKGGGGSSTDASSWNDLMIGTAELLVGFVLITLLTTTIKIGFQRHGECPEEQMLFQNLLALPLFYYMPNQWAQIGPRLDQFVANKDYHQALLLLSNLVLMFGHTHSIALFTARAPNMLLFQIVDTIKKFVIVVTTALGNAPPFPPTGFWGGSLVLVVGTLRFLSVSQPPPEEEADEVTLKEKKEK